MTSVPGSGDRTAPPSAEPFVQRLADGKAGARSGPGSDPKFTALKRDVKAKQQTLGKHPPAKTEADAAQGAAKPPQDDKEAQGKAANAEKMNAAKPGEFDKAAFVKAVNDAIAKQAPKNLDEADEFGDSGKADAVKGEVQGKVGAGKETSAKAIETTTKAPPDTAAAKDKPVTPLRPDQPPPKPSAPNPDQAVPDKAPPAATDFSEGPQQVDQQMADAQVTEEQLAKSNEPEFTGALKEKKEGEQHAATAPGQVRAAEAQTLAGAKAQAGQAGAAVMTTMTADRTKAGNEVGVGKEGAKSEDEKKREQVTAKLQKVFDATKKDVEDILNGLDKKVDDKFSTGEKAARDAFTAEYTRKMDAYKDERYSGPTGLLKWGKDKLFDLPSEVNVFYEQARKGYVDRMQGVISGVADVIGAELTRAKQRIATGRDELQAEVKKLPGDLQAIGKEAAGEFAGKFDELTESVNDKGTQLVDTLASKYTEALKAVDEEIAAEKEKNKGLVSKAVDAVKGAIDTILKLKDMLLGVLAKAAQAVMAIIKDPIGFLGKLISAVGAGLRAFMANIASHLQKGLVSWLLGAAAKAGLQLPERFDIKGILMLIGSLLGLTWGAIRGRVVQRGVPEQAMGAVESSVPIAQKIQSEGIGGVWEQLKEKVGDLKETLLGKIAQYLIPTVLIAGITWIVSLLNPASAFIKACKAIIDIVTFIVERGAQIMAFVNAVLDAVIAIAGGGAGGVPGLIETALATALPVLIGFLAALLGIGGLADKVKKLFQSLSKPVMKAVDWIVGKIAAFGKKIWAKLKAAGKKAKDKLRGGDDSPEGKQKRLDKAMSTAVAAANRLGSRPVGRMVLKPVLAGVRVRYGLTSLTAVEDGKTWAVVGKINPTRKDPTNLPTSDSANYEAWVQELKSALTSQELAKLAKMSTQKTSQQVHDMFNGNKEAAIERIRKGVEAEVAQQKIAEESKLRVNELRLTIADKKLMEDPEIRSLVDNMTPKNRADTVSKVRDKVMAKIRAQEALAEAQAKHPNADVLSEVMLYEKQREATIEEWKANNPGKGIGGLTQRPDGLYMQRGEIDMLVTARKPGAKVGIVHREEIKTGTRDTHADAHSQLQNAEKLLAAGGSGKIRLEAQGKDITGEIDMASDAGATKATRGPAGKGFDESLGVTANDLEVLVKELLAAKPVKPPEGGTQ
ncbi:MAG: hypothetical protein M3R63_18240 [Actinomycetota bacterium]|nr:hypothetical protein [Actinomycetota bacterium]